MVENWGVLLFNLTVLRMGTDSLLMSESEASRPACTAVCRLVQVDALLEQGLGCLDALQIVGPPIWEQPTQTLKP